MLTSEQQMMRALDHFRIDHPGASNIQIWRECYRLGHAAGVAAEHKRILSVLAKMIDGDSPHHDAAITDAMNRIERGEDA